MNIFNTILDHLNTQGWTTVSAGLPLDNDRWSNATLKRHTTSIRLLLNDTQLTIIQDNHSPITNHQELDKIIDTIDLNNPNALNKLTTTINNLDKDKCDRPKTTRKP